MTVKELKEILNRFDENMEVVVQFRDSGGGYNGADREVYFGVACATGDNKDYYDYLDYSTDSEGKKVIVL